MRHPFTTAAGAAGAPTGPSIRERFRASAAASAGNFVEWYDFGLYGFLAPVLALIFFPSTEPAAALMAAFAVYGVAFLTRPLGSLVFGHLGDRLGRRRTLSAVVILMSLSTFMIGVLPGPASIGVLAPLLLVLARMLQGFSAGGELGGAVAYISEFAPRMRRGRYGSWVFFTQASGSIAAAILVAILTFTLGAATMAEWGWRIPFLLALPIGLIGLYLRVVAKETPSFTALQQAGAVAARPLAATFRQYRRPVLQISGLSLTTTTGMLLVSAFVPAYLVEVEALSTGDALRASITGLLTLALLCPLFGALSDAIGRKPIMLATPIAAILLAFPAFVLFSTGDAGAALVGCALLGVVLAPFAGAGPAAFAELFPTRLRYTGIAVGSGITIAIVGGFAPLLLTWLVFITGSALAPAAVLAGVGVISLFAAASLRETSPAARRPWLQRSP